jgi:hypothetical protein
LRNFEQGEILVAKELNRRYADAGILSLTQCPGTVRTGLFRGLPKVVAWFLVSCGCPCSADRSFTETVFHTGVVSPFAEHVSRIGHCARSHYAAVWRDGPLGDDRHPRGRVLDTVGEIGANVASKGALGLPFARVQSHACRPSSTDMMSQADDEALAKRLWEFLSDAVDKHRA